MASFYEYKNMTENQFWKCEVGTYDEEIVLSLPKDSVSHKIVYEL